MTCDYAAAVEASPGYSPPRKWIAERLKQLDAEKDCTEIVRLSSLYHLNDMQLDWFYTLGTPAAGINPAVNDAVIRNGGGKFLTRATKRRDDSNDHMMTWLEQGAEAIATQRSVEMVNKYHEHYSKEYPMGFEDVTDYIYILCLNATLVDSAQKQLGEPGFDAKQRKATHLVWSRIANSFTMPDGRPVTDLSPFPNSYEGMEHCVRSYLQRPWPEHEPSRRSTMASIERFSKTWFPQPLQFLGYAMITAFMPEELLRAHKIQRPNPVAAWLARSLMKFMMVISRLLPDPHENIQDRRRRLVSEGKAARSPVDIQVHRWSADGVGKGDSAVLSGMCPHVTAASRTVVELTPFDKTK